MTTVMLLLAWFGIATPLVIFGDRLSVFIPAGPFFALMGRVGGYNHMKQLGVGSVIAGQLVVGAFGGMVYGLHARDPARRVFATMSSSFCCRSSRSRSCSGRCSGRIIADCRSSGATVVTLVGLLVCVRRLRAHARARLRFSNSAARARASRHGIHSADRPARFVLERVSGLLVAGGGAAIAAANFIASATFSYDGTQYKGRVVQPITPNDQFYCVTKNVVDPKVNVDLWRLEVTGLVQNPRDLSARRLEDRFRPSNRRRP